MKRIYLISFLVCVYTLGLITTTAIAQDQGWYAGIGVGQTKVKDPLVCDLDITCSSDDKDTGWKVYGGYQFNANGAFEFGYVDLGEATFNGTDSFLGTADASFESSGFNVALAGFLPVGNNISVTGKVGLFLWDLDVNVNSSVWGSGSLSEDGADLMYGIGVQFGVNEQIAVRAEWESYKDIGDEGTTGQSDIDMLSANLVFKFQ